MHAPSEEKSGDWKDSFYKELEQVFNYFPENRMKNFIRFWFKSGDRGNIFKPTIVNESLHKDSNGISVRIVNFATKIISC